MLVTPSLFLCPVSILPFFPSTTIYMFQIMGWTCYSLFLYLAFFFSNSFPILVTTLPAYGYLLVNSPISWTNIEPTGDFVNSPTLWTDREPTGNFNKPYAGIILASRYFSYTDYGSACGCGCGFFCNQTCNSSPFALFRIYFLSSNYSILTDGSNVVWSANPNNPVRYNATLNEICGWPTLN